MSLAAIISEIEGYEHPMDDHDGSYSLTHKTILRAIELVKKIYEMFHILPDRISPAEGVILKYPRKINIEIEEDQIVILDKDLKDYLVNNSEESLQRIACLLA